MIIFCSLIGLYSIMVIFNRGDSGKALADFLTVCLLLSVGGCTASILQQLVF